MMRKPVFTIFLFITLFVFLVPAHSKSIPRKGLFEQKCVKCHSLSKSLGKRKTKEGWIRTVERMRRKNSKLISEAESEEIAEYLYSVREKKGRKIKRIKKEKKLITTPGRDVAVTKITPENELKDKHKSFQKLDVDQFIKPDVCAGCHEEIFKQWSGSMHGKSFKDPLWQASTKLFALEVKTEGEILESRMCIKCHAPLGYRSHTFTSPEDNFNDVPELVKQGVFCNWCHNISDIKSLGNADYGLSSGGGEDDPIYYAWAF